MKLAHFALQSVPPPRAQAFAPSTEPKPAIFKGDLRPTPRIGTIDHTYTCSACEAQAHDILHEARGVWHLECAFCGATQRAHAIAGHIKPKAVEFVFRGGRCEGMTLAEAAATPRGADYLAWCRDSHDRQEVRDVCKKYLDLAASAP